MLQAFSHLRSYARKDSACRHFRNSVLVFDGKRQSLPLNLVHRSNSLLKLLEAR